MKRLGLSSYQGPVRQLRVSGARAAVALAVVAGSCIPVLAEAYPTRTVTLVVPFPAGGGTDTLARPLVEQLKERLGQPVIIDNRGGGGSNIGNSAAARSAADGYTLLINTDTMAVLPLLFAKLTYDPINDLTPVGYVASVPMVIAINPKVPVNSVQDLGREGATRQYQSQLRKCWNWHAAASCVRIVVPRRRHKNQSGGLSWRRPGHQ